MAAAERDVEAAWSGDRPAREQREIDEANATDGPMGADLSLSRLSFLHPSELTHACPGVRCDGMHYGSHFPQYGCHNSLSLWCPWAATPLAELQLDSRHELRETWEARQRPASPWQAPAARWCFVETD